MKKYFNSRSNVELNESLEREDNRKDICKQDDLDYRVWPFDVRDDEHDFEVIEVY